MLGASKEALGIEHQPLPWWKKGIVKATMAASLLALTILLGYILGNKGQLFNERNMQASRVEVMESKLDWPAIITRSRSLPQSVNSLFAAWRIALDEEITQPCELAKKYDLACHWFKGNLTGLLKLGYPAVLKLNDEQGGAFYGLLDGVEGDKLTFHFAEHRQLVDKEWLAKYWQGGALIFWQAPISSEGEFVDVIGSESDSEHLQWLESRLSEIQNRPQRRVQSLDATLINQLQQYQRSKGVSVQNSAGQQTLMMLANTVAEGLPIFTIKNS